MISGLDTHQKTNFTLVTIANFLLFCNFASLFLQPLFIQHLGGDEATIGFVMGSFGFTSLGSMPIVGTLIDKHGRKRFLVLGALVMIVGTLGNTLIDGIGPAIFIPRLLQGAGFGMFFTSAATAAADYLPEHKRAHGLGIFGAFTIAAYAVGPPIGELVIDRLGFDAFFITISLFSVAALGIVAFLEDAPRVLGGRERGRGFFSIAFSRRYAPLLLTNVALSGSFGAVLIFIAPYIKSLGLEAYLFFTTYALVVTLMRVFISRFADRVPRRWVAAPSLLFFSLAVAGLSLIGSAGTLLLMALVFSLSYGMLYPTLAAMVIDKAAADERGKAMGAFNACFSLGINFLAFGFGIIARELGYGPMYIIASGFAFLGFFVFYFGERDAPARLE